MCDLVHLFSVEVKRFHYKGINPCRSYFHLVINFSNIFWISNVTRVHEGNMNILRRFQFYILGPYNFTLIETVDKSYSGISQDVAIYQGQIIIVLRS